MAADIAASPGTVAVTRPHGPALLRLLEQWLSPLSLRHRRGRLTLAIVVARCLNAAAIGMLVSASITMLYNLVRAKTKGLEDKEEKPEEEGDEIPLGADGEFKLVRQVTPTEVHTKVQSISTHIGTVVTLIDFVTGPLIGRSMDASGRLPTMVLGLGLSGLARLVLAAAPSLPLYFAYRVLTAITGPTFFGSTMASLGDLYGRGTTELSAASSMVTRYALLAMMAGTYTGRLFKNPRSAFVACGSLQLTGAAVLALGMQETLAKRTAMDWSLRKISPVSFINFFGQSRALTALALLSSLRDVSAFVNIDMVYRRQKFAKWGRKQESDQMVVAQACGFLSTFVRTPLMTALGLEATARLHSWLEALIHLNNAFAPRMEMLSLNPLIGLFMAGGEATGRCMQQEAERLNLGSGALGAAEANRVFIPCLVMPHFFTRVYNRLSETAPATPYLIAITAALLSAEVGVPSAFQRLSASVRDAAKGDGRFLHHLRRLK